MRYKNPIKIKMGPYEFKSKTEAASLIRAALKKIEFGPHKPDSKEYGFLYELLKLHPEFKNKTAKGVACFYVVQLNNGGSEVQIVNDSDAVEAFSWIKCVTGKANNTADSLKAAMRGAIRLQISEFRKNNYNGACSVCLSQVDFKDTHVDHVLPFKNLYSDFVAIHSNAPELFADDPVNNAAVFREEDSAYSDAWQAYHKEKASLRVTCKSCNLARGKG